MPSPEAVDAITRLGVAGLLVIAVGAFASGRIRVGSLVDRDLNQWKDLATGSLARLELAAKAIELLTKAVEKLEGIIGELRKEISGLRDELEKLRNERDVAIAQAVEQLRRNQRP